MAGVLFSSLKVNFQAPFRVANVLQTSPAFTGVVGMLNIENSEIPKLISTQRSRRNTLILNIFIITYGHTFATAALQNGVDVKTVSSMLGHYDAGFTLRTYTHATRQKQEQAAERMGNFMEKVM